MIVVPEDSGNALVLGEGVVRVREDGAAKFRHWFHFRVQGTRGDAVEVRMVDMATTSYAGAWEGYRACGSHDGERWIRLDTSYADGELRIRAVLEGEVLHVAAFAPYPWERHLARFGTYEAVGHSVEGRPIHRVVLGGGPLPVWVIARQHPGESMAEWFVEGLLDGLAGSPLLERATFHVVPNMNPDGTFHGNLRTNAAGVDLNRAWVAPDPATAPEVHAVLAEMDRTGVALALDVHGDEVIPYNFVSGPESTPSWDPRRQALLDRFCARWLEVSPDFQTEQGYPRGAPGEANLTICSNQLAERFRCLALTVEQPFKDIPGRPGWGPDRARELGKSVLDPISAVTY